tara:strand:- start:185 stop:586 length:402 start_codon:yes stop_codon:yes gene_type:complete
MSDQLAWDASLVKKFSSSNHFKLLNQLRSEVKKYPINKKINSTSNTNQNNKFTSNNADSAIDSEGLSSKITNSEINLNQSRVSFNNSKNFSIYNNINNESTKNKKEIIQQEELKRKEDSSSSFKDRLDKIDLK